MLSGKHSPPKNNKTSQWTKLIFSAHYPPPPFDNCGAKIRKSCNNCYTNGYQVSTVMPLKRVFIQFYQTAKTTYTLTLDNNEFNPFDSDHLGITVHECHTFVSAFTLLLGHLEQGQFL